VVLVHQVIPHALRRGSLCELQSNFLRLRTYRRLEVDVLETMVVQKRVPLSQPPVANEGTREPYEPPAVKNPEYIAASTVLQPSVRLPPVKLSANLL